MWTLAKKPQRSGFILGTKGWVCALAVPRQAEHGQHGRAGLLPASHTVFPMTFLPPTKEMQPCRAGKGGEGERGLGEAGVGSKVVLLPRCEGDAGSGVASRNKKVTVTLHLVW